MKLIYKGHEISVARERSMAGYSMLYYSVFRVADGYECTSGFQDSNEAVKDFVGVMKERVDAELMADNPWGERESANKFGPSESGTPTPGPLTVDASGDPDFPFFVSPLDSDGISLPPIAAFKHHADALRFVECAKVQP